MVMLQRLRDFLRSPAPVRLPQVPAGTRYYAIGDIHGRLDLYEVMIAAIEDEIAAHPRCDHRIILLGDLVDRGPDSAGVIRRTREWQATRNVRVLAGNHEDMFLAAFKKPESLRHFLKHGGYETVLSFGFSPHDLGTLPLEDLHAMYCERIPQDVREYVAAFELMIRAGDYIFVHAGIDPARPLTEQKRTDLLWIRAGFLDYDGPLEKVVIHGHTIFDHVMDCGNRIGIDTGAFRSGVLTALVLEGDQRRILQARTTESGAVELFHGDRPH